MNTEKCPGGQLEPLVTRQRDGFPVACVCDGEGCPGCDEAMAIEFADDMAAAEARYAVPPCLECGAVSAEEAETKCICGGDKDDCHGCHLWPY